MAPANVTGDEQQKTLEELLCSAGWTAELHGHLTFISVLNSFLSITAFLGNALILIALRKESSLRPPSKLLLRCLATTDLCVGLISEPLTVIYWMSQVVMNEHWCGFTLVASFIAAYILCSVSLLTLTAISVDRLLALLLGLRYRQVVTLKRTHVIVVMFWVVSTVLSGMSFWNPLVIFWSMIIVVSCSLATSIFSYTKIFFTLRHHQNQVHDNVQQPNQTNQLNIARYRKAVSSALWLQLTLVACFLPRGIAVALLTKRRLSPSIFLVNQYTIALVYLNSLLNPILYCWKIDEVRQVVKATIRQVLCCWSS